MSAAATRSKSRPARPGRARLWWRRRVARVRQSWAGNSARWKVLPYALVCLFVLAAICLVIIDRWRRGTVVLGAGLLVGGWFRLLMPDDIAGMLKVRSKPVDTVTLLGLGLVILWLARSVDALGT